MSWEKKQTETCSNHFIIELKNQNRKGIKSSKNIQGRSTTIKYRCGSVKIMMAQEIFSI